MAPSPDILAAIAVRLAAHAGLEPPAWVVEARVAARMAALGLDLAGYLALIDGSRGAGELAALVEAVRVGETRLFRHRPQVAALIDLVVPALRARGRRPVKVWSAGCAAGEEPYTLAIVLGRLLAGAPVSILATDVSAEALDAARAAAYPAAALDDVPPEWRDGFVLDGDLARVRPELAQTVRFERRNLADDNQPRGFDLVWCRNVLIYFAPEARRRAVEALVAALDPGGFLFVGYSESLRDVAGLEAVRSGEAVCYRKSEAAPRRTPPAGVPIAAPRAVTPPAGVPIVAAAKAAPAAATVRVLRLHGTCDPVALTAELTAHLAAPGLRELAIDLDDAALIPDDVAPVLRRARAAAEAAGVALGFRATRNGARRWLRRHGLEVGA